MNSPYPSEFLPRVKGQRYESINDDFIFEGAGVDCQVVGHFDGFDGFGAPAQYDAIVLVRNGRRWPCYRRTASSPGQNFAICLNHQYRSVPV